MQTVIHPAFGGLPVKYDVALLPDSPDGQVAGTIALMKHYVREDSCSPEVVRDALAAVGGESGLAHMTDRAKAEAVFTFVKGRLRFVEDEKLTGWLQAESDEPIVEALIRPVDMAVMCEAGACERVGDCDDFSMYAAALCKSLGLRTAFVTVAADPANPEHFSHVYVVAYTKDGQAIPLDCSHGAYAGWEYPNPTRRKEWAIDGPDMVTLLAAGVLAYCAAKFVGAV